MRQMLQDSQGKLGKVRQRIEDLRSEVALSGLSTEQKSAYLRLIEEKATLFANLRPQIEGANSQTISETAAKRLVTTLLDINEDVLKIKELFDAGQMQQKKAETTPPIVAPTKLKKPEASTSKTAAPPPQKPINAKLEAAKNEVTASFMEARVKFQRMKESLAKFSQSVAPSQMNGLSLKQKTQRIANVSSMQQQFFALEAKVNNIGNVLGSMASSVTPAQIVQMKQTVKEISDGSIIIENRITKEKNRTSTEQPDAMPRAPTAPLRNKGPRN